MKILLLFILILCSCNKENICSIDLVPPPPDTMSVPDSTYQTKGRVSYFYFKESGYAEYRYLYVGGNICWTEMRIRKH